VILYYSFTLTHKYFYSERPLQSLCCELWAYVKRNTEQIFLVPKKETVSFFNLTLLRTRWLTLFIFYCYCEGQVMTLCYIRWLKPFNPYNSKKSKQLLHMFTFIFRKTEFLVTIKRFYRVFSSFLYYFPFPHFPSWATTTGFCMSFVLFRDQILKKRQLILELQTIQTQQGLL